MGIALLALADLLMPLHTLAHRWLPARRARAATLRYVAVRPACTVRTPLPGGAQAIVAARPLRVVRLVDAQAPHAGRGRLVISGRMADVCAELERLVALENSASPPVATPLH